MFCRNKKFYSVEITFSCTLVVNTNFGQYWLSTRYFLGDFNGTFTLLFFHAHVPKNFIEKYPKIKYAISDRPHWWQLDLCETSFLLLNGSH
jgi:hypothetical protein